MHHPHTIKYKERFAVQLGRNLVWVQAEDVACFCKDEIIFLINREGRKYITDYRSLDEVEGLIKPTQFFRANRQHIVSLFYIASMRGGENGKIYLNMKLPAFNEITISKEKAAGFRRWVKG